MPQKSYLGYCASLQPFYTQAALGMPWNLQCTQALWDRPSEKENALYLHSQCLALEEAHRVRPGLLFCWNCSSWHCVTVSHGSSPVWICELWENFSAFNTTTKSEHSIFSLAAGFYQHSKCCSTETCSASGAFTIPDTWNSTWEDSLEADLPGWAEAPLHSCPWGHTLAPHCLCSSRDVHWQPPPNTH